MLSCCPLRISSPWAAPWQSSSWMAMRCLTCPRYVTCLQLLAAAGSHLLRGQCVGAQRSVPGSKYRLTSAAAGIVILHTFLTWRLLLLALQPSLTTRCLHHLLHAFQQPASTPSNNVGVRVQLLSYRAGDFDPAPSLSKVQRQYWPASPKLRQLPIACSTMQAAGLPLLVCIACRQAAIMG